MRTVKMFVFAIAAMIAVAGMPFKSASVGKIENKISLISVAHADTAPAPAVSASPAPSVGDKIGNVGDQIGSLADKIPLSGTLVMVLGIIAGYIYDLIRRKWPTKNPASLWRDIKSVLDGVKKVFAGLGALIDKIDQFGDKVLGQNVQ